ncbi:serine/threonine-protein kinase [Salininema proteolyticum]|uniref:non-specific serine/threonine protein kinase n=1 Tax=Salininema proteolyticum TaxID=1607685 RepID=A0ABV8U2S5_9ACTN
MSYFDDPNEPGPRDRQHGSGAFGSRFQTASWNQTSRSVTPDSSNAYPRQDGPAGLGAPSAGPPDARPYDPRFTDSAPDQGFGGFEAARPGGFGPAQSQPGDMIGGRYRLDQMIGRGGNGSVWRGLDTTLQRDVAIKAVTLPAEIPAEERQQLIERSMREAQITAGISHPSVIRVFDVVQHEDVPWIVMELLQARSLAEILESDGPLPLRVSSKIGLALTGALQAAHEAGIIHRDIKPGNVLITADGRCILTDFGAAQQHSVSGGTAPGKVLGSAHYIAPERAVGGRAEPASDVFSLGVTLYAACEGRPPFHRGDVISTMRAVVNDPPESPLNAGELTPLLGSMLKKDPQARCTLNEARHELSSLLSGPLANGATGLIKTGAHTAAHGVEEPPPPPPAGDAGSHRTRDDDFDDEPRKSRKGLVFALVLILVLAGGGYFGYKLLTGGEGGGEPTDPPSDEQAESDEPTDDEGGEDSEDESEPLATETFSGEGYSADYPNIWQQGQDGTYYNSFVNPANADHWIRFYNNSLGHEGQTAQDYLVGVMQAQGGEEVRSEAAQVAGMDGYLVEFTNTGEDGVEYRNLFALAVDADGLSWGVYVSGSTEYDDVSAQAFEQGLESYERTG